MILVTGFERADPIASLVIATPMIRSGYKLITASGRIFMEASPKELDPEQIGHAMAAVPGVCEVHDLHIWEVTSGFPALYAHVLVPPHTDCHQTPRARDAARRSVRDPTHHAPGRTRDRTAAHPGAA